MVVSAKSCSAISGVVSATRHLSTPLTAGAGGERLAVKRQITLLDETLTPEEFLEQLEQEHKVKPDIKWARSIGF